VGMTTRESSKSVTAAAVLGAFLAVGLVAAGALAAKGIRDAKAADRYVTVRGLCEREVAANLAMWPIVFGATGDELGALQDKMDASAKKIVAFLQSRGFTEKELSPSAPRVTDFEAQGYAGNNRPPHRYAAEATITVRSVNVTGVIEGLKHSGELVRDGVTLTNNFGTSFLYTELEKVKPEMIAAATKDARRAAEQFASDSGSRVGTIRNAQQGYFTIEDRDAFSPEWKKLRVVTTVEYFLED
jgi:hypothetical protein